MLSALVVPAILKWLASSGVGLLGSVLDQFFKGRQDAADKAHELEILDRQLKSRELDAVAHRDEVAGQLDAEKMKAQAAEVAALYASWTPSGVKWVDAANQMMRPLACAVCLVIFAAMALVFLRGMFFDMKHHTLAWTDAIQIFGASMFADVILAVWGFLFGYRLIRGRGSQG